jgi:hypothetical protein
MCGDGYERGHSCIDVDSLLRSQNDEAMERIAELLRMSSDSARALVGDGWFIGPEVTREPLPDGTEGRLAWFSSGATVEVLLALPTVHGGAASVFVPKITWHGPGDPVLTAGRLVATGPVDDGLDRWLPEALADARRRRRRTFRRCRECGEPAAPEEREGDICHGCMELDGVVY